MKKKIRVGVGTVLVAFGIGLAVWACTVSKAIPVNRLPVLAVLLMAYLAGAFVTGIGVGTCAEGIKQILGPSSGK